MLSLQNVEDEVKEHLDDIRSLYNKIFKHIDELFTLGFSVGVNYDEVDEATIKWLIDEFYTDSRRLVNTFEKDYFKELRPVVHL